MYLHIHIHAPHTHVHILIAWGRKPQSGKAELSIGIKMIEPREVLSLVGVTGERNKDAKQTHWNRPVQGLELQTIY